MTTYGEKIREYEARVRKAQELGIEPREEDLKKLYYYVGRTERKGADCDITQNDRSRWQIINTSAAMKALIPRLKKNAPQILDIANMISTTSREVDDVRKLIEQNFGDASGDYIFTNFFDYK